MRVLLIEDELAVARGIEMILKSEGFNVYSTDLGEEGVNLAKLYEQDIILLDLHLPDISGLDVVRALRAAKVETPIMILSGSAEIESKVRSLGVGADDYVTKPFDLRELLARIHALLRRMADAEPAPAPASTATPTRFVFAGWQLDTVARGLTNTQGRDVALTAGEFDLLRVFVQRPGRVLSRDVLLEQTHRRDAAPFDRTIDVQVGRLRKKLEVDAQDPQIIKSVRSAGYILVPPVSGS